MIMFWIAAALLSAGAGALMLQMSMRGLGAGEHPALALHRRQLAEIDALAGRDLLDDAEHRAARTEAARRLLEVADDATAPAEAMTRSGRPLVLIVAVAAPLIAAGLYVTVAGAPGVADQPFLARVQGWKANPEGLDWTQRVAVAGVDAAARPRDPAALKDLAVANLFAGDAASAEAAARRALAMAPQDPEVFTLLAAAFTREAGAVTPSAREAMAKAQALVAPLSPADPLRQRIDAQVSGVGAMAREAQAQAQAQTPAGPTPATAGQVTPAAIRQMVATLAARLKADPDDPQGWVMLVRAYNVLGDIQARDQTLAQAKARYARDKAVLGQLEQAKGSQP
jgi:cytochrome c-type biogenesis protein CcmH